MKIFTALLVSAFCAFTALGQSSVKGLIVDANTLEPLPGVTVILEGTTKGVATDLDGMYTLNISQAEKETGNLNIRFLGYEPQTIAISGRDEINISLNPDSELLEEVVVTAIGIERDKRKVGYSVTTVDGSELLESRETNIVTALNAKVAGVQVTSTSGSPGASATIRIRGNQSINGNNDPLYVIDGIPIDNSYRGSNFTDQANRAIDIDPNDVASMTVLKGGAASALYGIRAANGAIIINTKQGKAGKTEVTFSTTTTLDRVNKLPEMQNTFAQGSGGDFISGANTSWGPRIDNLFYAYQENNGGFVDSSRINNEILVPAGDPLASNQRARSFDNSENFFRTGITLNNSLNIRGGNEKSGFFLSLNDLRQTGVVPLTEYNRSSIRATARTSISTKLDVKVSANYISSKADRAQRGSNLSGVMLGLMRTPPSYDLTNGVDDPVDNPESYQFDDGTQRTFHDAYDNPYWSVNKNRNEEDLDRLIGFVEFVWRPFEWMTVTERAGIDTYNEIRKSYWDRGSNEFKDLGGAIFDETFKQRNITNDLLVNMNFPDVAPGFDFSAIVGHSYQDFNSTSYIVDGYDFVIDDFYDMSNISAINVVADDFISRSRLIGGFADLSFDYQRTYYLTLTGRVDQSSTLPTGNNTFFYPSGSFGFVFTELVPLGFIEYGKLRTSYAITGNAAYDAYLTSNFFVSGGSTQDQLAFFPNAVIGSNTLTPEFTNSFEIGTDLRSKNNRVRLDYSFYNTSSTDQIVEIPIANSTGYSSFITNIGRIDNRGHEVLLGVDILERKLSQPNKLGWTTTVNFTRNRSEVVELTSELSNISLPSTGVASTQARVIEGYQYGVLYGSRWLRNGNGDIIVNDEGYPIRDDENGIIGDPNPDFTAGWRNAFSYQNWQLSFLIDIRVGGDMYNGTRAVMSRLGTHADTENRAEEIVFEGVVEGSNIENTAAIRLDEDFYSRYGLTGVSEMFVEEVYWVRMRDVNLTYNFSPELCDKLRISRASASFTARNLFLITDYSGIDPETSLGGASNAFGRDYFNNPNTKSYGINLTLTF